jgi:hypothetical protein
MAGIGPVRLAEHNPGIRLGERIGGAVDRFAVKGDGGEGRVTIGENFSLSS